MGSAANQLPQHVLQEHRQCAQTSVHAQGAGQEGNVRMICSLHTHGLLQEVERRMKIGWDCVTSMRASTKVLVSSCWHAHCCIPHRGISRSTQRSETGLPKIVLTVNTTSLLTAPSDFIITYQASEMFQAG